jgi:hypothetical protein
MNIYSDFGKEKQPIGSQGESCFDFGSNFQALTDHSA